MQRSWYWWLSNWSWWGIHLQHANENRILLPTSKYSIQSKCNFNFTPFHNFRDQLLENATWKLQMKRNLSHLSCQSEFNNSNKINVISTHKTTVSFSLINCTSLIGKYVSHCQPYIFSLNWMVQEFLALQQNEVISYHSNLKNEEMQIPGLVHWISSLLSILDWPKSF